MTGTGFLRKLRVRNAKLLVTFLVVLFSANLTGQNPPPPSDLKGNVGQGTKPDDWLKAEKKDNEGKWNQTDSVSAPMAQILQVVTDALAEQWNTNRDPCKQAAAGIGYSVVFDAYSSAGLYDLLGRLKGAISDILSLGEAEIGKFLKDKGKDALKDLIKEKLSKEKPEVYIAEVTKAKCKVKLVAIWDKAAGTYDVTVYGDCECNPVATGSIRGSVLLRTFAIQAKGKVSFDVDSTKQVPILVVGPPKVTIEAKCGCATPTTGVITPPQGPGTTPQGPGTTPQGPGTTPQPGTPGGTTPQPQPPPDVTELCKQKPPCKECMPIYDRIVAACKRIEEIDRELRDLAGEHDGNANRQAAVQAEIGQLQQKGAAAAGQLAAKQQELSDLQREARNIEVNARNLGVERLGLEGKLRDLSKQMKECEKTRCGTGKVIELPPEGTSAPPEQPKTPSTPPKLGEGGSFKSIQPKPGTGAGSDQGAYLPPIAGPGSTIFATVVDDKEAGPHGVIVATVDDAGNRNYFQGVTDTLGHFAFVVPAGVSALELIHAFDSDGKPSVAAHCDVGQISHVTETNPVLPAKIPAKGPAIVEANSAIERGGPHNGTVTLHTRGTDPMTTKLLMDDTPLQTFAASDSSVVGRLADNTPQGTHQFSVESGGVKSNSFPADVVTIHSDPVPVIHVGTIVTLRVHVEGIPAGHVGVVHFDLGGAVQVVGGAQSVDAPLRDGVASIRVQGVRPGQMIARFTVRVSIPGYWALEE